MKTDTPTPLAPETSELENLLANATPGPWAYEAHGDTGQYGVGLCFADDDHDCERPLRGQVESDVTVEDPVAVEVCGQPNARLIALTPTLAAEVIALRAEVATLRESEARMRDIVDYVLQDPICNRLVPRVVDIAYSAFMVAKRPNTEDGGPSDWFTDTRPMVMEKIAEIRSAALQGEQQ